MYVNSMILNLVISFILKQIYRKCYGQHVGFNMFMDNMLHSMVRKMVLPDIEFIVNLGDWPLVDPKVSHKNSRFVINSYENNTRGGFEQEGDMGDGKFTKEWKAYYYMKEQQYPETAL